MKYFYIVVLLFLLEKKILIHPPPLELFSAKETVLLEFIGTQKKKNQKLDQRHTKGQVCPPAKTTNKKNTRFL